MLSASLKIIPVLYYILFFVNPLIFYTKTSELFEFNKIVFVYLFTILITVFWIIRSLYIKKFVFVRTKFNISLLLFLFSQIISTLFSIDIRTSIFGYYSRFHGGLLSSISYCFLFWIFLSVMNKKRAIISMKSLLFSSFIVGVYAILQHLGIDKNIWVQDVQTRVFSTLGQPNWLAAWLTALIPLSWLFLIKSKKPNSLWKYSKKYFWLFLYGVQLSSLVFTKSKSGFLAFILSFLVFWSLLFITSAINGKIINFIKNFILILIFTFSLLLYFGTPWIKGVENNLFNNNESVTETIDKPTGTALETGGTDSGKIRFLVWRGAFNAFKNYPIIGSGVETFAFVFYQFRPIEHNMVSEWDFLYNKAHNEYLNFLTTTGTVGFLAYLFLIISILILFFDSKHKSNLRKNNRYNFLSAKLSKINIYQIALLSGFVSILITNFFGFSVVSVGLIFFLFPAFAIFSTGLDKRKININFDKSISLIFIPIAIGAYLIFSLFHYWLADYNYAQGKNFNDIYDFQKASIYLNNSIKLVNKEPIYWDELAKTNAEISLVLLEENMTERASDFAQLSYTENLNAISLSGTNVNFKRNMAANLVRFHLIDNQYLILAQKTLSSAILQAPNDPKLFYNLGLVYIRLGNLQDAKEALVKSSLLKPNYRNAHFGLGLVYWDLNDKTNAKAEFEYILNNINPYDEEVKRQLEELLQS